MQRTYSRKGANRQSRTSEVHSELSSSQRSPSRKKRKVEVEVISTKSSASESERDEPMRNSRKQKQTTTHRPHSSIGNGSTAKASTSVIRPPVSLSTRSLKPVSTSAGSMPAPSLASRLASPEKAVKDLTSLFDFTVSPKPSPITAPRGGVAKRMLRRTNTDTSLPTNRDDTSPFSTIDHSMIAGPSTPRKLTGSRTEPAIGSGSPSPRTPGRLFKSSEDFSSSPVRPSIAASTSIRTYGGKSRSFLVELPKSASASALLGPGSQSQSQENDLLQPSQEEEFEIRESYTELRARWGVDNSEDDPWPPPVNLTTVDAEASPNSKRKGKGKQALPPPPQLPPGMMNDLKSITELRIKGETRRFFDDMGYLFEGLDPKGAIGVRRGSALEIVTKLCDLDFSRKAKAADFLEKAWEALREAGAGDGDKVLDTILVFFASLAARDPRDLPDLASKSDFVPILFRLLGSWGRENDPLWLISCGLSDAELKKVGISKAEKLSLTTLHTLVRKKSAIFDAVDVICNRVLTSHALSLLPPSTYTLSHFHILLQTLSAEIHPFPSRLSAYTSGISLFPPLSSDSHSLNPSLLHINNCIRLLDSFLLGRWADEPELDGDNSADLYNLKQMESEGARTLASGLKALCVVTDIMSRKSDSDSDDNQTIALACLESLLRVLINLSHDNPVWCQSLVKDPLLVLALIRVTMLSHRQHLDAVGNRSHVVSGEKDQEEAEDESDAAAQLLDRLCLSLGLLTNLVQTCEEAKEVLRLTQLDPQCPGKRACVPSCRCRSRITSIQCLVQVYTNYTNSDNPVVLMLRGHVAILLGLLVQNDNKNQDLVLQALPSPPPNSNPSTNARGARSADQAKLTGLIENAKEFAAFYVEFAKKISSTVVDERDDEHSVMDVDEGNDDVSKNLDEVVRGVNVRGMLKDRQGESVARDVIRYLEGLRDKANS